MKKHNNLLLTMLCMLFSFQMISQMELVVNTYNLDSTIITLPLSGTVNVEVDWGDGNIETITTHGLHEHNYVENGTYYIKLSGELSWFGSEVENTTIAALEKVISFGDLGIESFKNAFNNADSLESVPQSIPSSVQSLHGCFSYIDQTNIINLDKWDVSNVTDMSSLFFKSESFNQDISKWYTGNVTDMNYTFFRATAFNQNICSWDVSSVVNMSCMFKEAYTFNGDISCWDVSNVTDMEYMFFMAEAFNQDIRNWNVSKVTNMRKMFSNAEKFNQDIGDWDVSNVMNMHGMFSDTYAFNQDIGRWDVSNVTDMSFMFWGAFSIDLDLTGWCVEQIPEEPNSFLLNNMYQKDINLPFWGRSCNSMKLVYDLSYIEETTIGLALSDTVNVVVNWGDDTIDTITSSGYFEHTYDDIGIYQVSISGQLSTFGSYGYDQTNALLKVCDFGDIGISSLKCAFRRACNLISVPVILPITVYDLNNCFSHISQENITNLEAWDVSNVLIMRNIFYNSANFNHNIGCWDVGNVTDMSFMFNYADSFNQDISDWDVSNVTSMWYMFNGAVSFNQDIGGWDVSNVMDMKRMFCSASSFNQNISGWCVEQIAEEPTSFDWHCPLNQKYKPFWGTSCNAMKLVYNTENADGTKIGFNLTEPNNVIIFWGDNTFDSVTSGSQYEHTFFSEGLYQVYIIGEFSKFSTDYNESGKDALVIVSDFGECGIKSLENAFDDNDSLLAVPYMLPPTITNLSGCFTNIDKKHIKNLSKWNLNHVVDMSRMFFNAVNFNENIGEWDVRNVKDMSYLFYNATSFNNDIGNWDVGKVIDMNHMFFNATEFNQKISNWNVSKTEDMNNMFAHAVSFNQSIGTWDVGNVTNMEDMLLNASSFNQYINNWNVGNVVNMHGMFSGAYLFNNELNSWDVSKVINMSMMFYGASSFNKELSNWDVSNVIDMRDMFNDASSFEQNISGWCVEHISIEPVDFTLYCPINTVNLPKWGKPCNIGFSEHGFKSDDFLIYPNPAKNYFKIDEHNNSEIIRFEIYNHTGDRIKSIAPTGNKYDISNFPQGIYCIRIYLTDIRYVTRKLVVVK